MSTPHELTVLRAEVDALDRALVDVLAQRRDVVQRIAAYKRGAGMAARDSAREAQMWADLSAQAAARGVPEGLVREVLDAVLRDSRRVVDGG